jgi:predicted transcriptional regulator
MKSKNTLYKIPGPVRMKVVRYFKNNSNNSSPEIAKHYNMNVKTVNLILDKYFKKLKQIQKIQEQWN